MQVGEEPEGGRADDDAAGVPEAEQVPMVVQAAVDEGAEQEGRPDQDQAEILHQAPVPLDPGRPPRVPGRNQPVHEPEPEPGDQAEQDDEEIPDHQDRAGRLGHGTRATTGSGQDEILGTSIGGSEVVRTPTRTVSHPGLHSRSSDWGR